MDTDTTIQILDSLNRINQDSIHLIISNSETQQTIADQVALWGQAIGGLFTAITFIYLIIKDNKRRKEISQLATIAQNSIAQVELLKEMNNLTTRQMNILTEMAVAGTNDKAHANELVDIERTRLKIENKPNLKLTPSSSDPDRTTFRIENKGKTAHIEHFKLLEGRVHLHIAAQILEQGSVISIEARSTGDANMNKEKIVFLLRYTDEIGTKYQTTFRVRDTPREETAEIQQEENS